MCLSAVKNIESGRLPPTHMEDEALNKVVIVQEATENVSVRIEWVIKWKAAITSETFL